jgi:hypothetical protein
MPSKKRQLNFPQLGGHQDKPEGSFRPEVFNEPETEEVLS